MAGAAALLTSATAGVLGSLGASCGKLAGRALRYGSWPGAAAAVATLIGCNALGLTCYVRSLADMPSLQATSISNTFNTVASGVLGRLVFAEPLPARWWLGVTALAAGTLLVSAAVAAVPSARPAAAKAMSYKKS